MAGGLTACVSACVGACERNFRVGRVTAAPEVRDEEDCGHRHDGSILRIEKAEEEEDRK